MPRDLFAENEQRRMASLRDALFGDPGYGPYHGNTYPHVLLNPALNLWAGVREDAIEYFKRNEIAWFERTPAGPTGNLLSSQVACVNHLYPLRQRRDLARAVLVEIDGDVEDVVIVDDGYVEFEFIGSKQYLAERMFCRGMHCTSVDAFMIGRTRAGERRAFLIEWKY